MQIPTTSDHLWTFAEHGLTVIGWSLAAWHWFKRKAETMITRIVTKAVQEAIKPLADEVEIMKPVFESIRNYVKPNGKAMGAS